MRAFSHWTPRYAYSRMAEILYRWSNPDAPWLTKDANLFLQRHIKSHHVGLEFGSGRSTLWLARHMRSLISVEHSRKWFEKVGKSLSAAGINNVSSVLASDSIERDTLPGYLSVFDGIKPGSLDLVLVDGIFRDECALRSIDCLKSGGLLVLDNANLYLPSASLSPNSRSISEGAASPRWAEFRDATSHWEKLWTTNGVSDTLMLFKTTS